MVHFSKWRLPAPKYAKCPPVEIERAEFALVVRMVEVARGRWGGGCVRTMRCLGSHERMRPPRCGHRGMGFKELGNTSVRPLLLWFLIVEECQRTKVCARPLQSICASPSVGISRTVLELPGYGGRQQAKQARPSASFVRDRAAFVSSEPARVKSCLPGSEVLRRSSHAASRSHRRPATHPCLRRCGGRRSGQSERRRLSAPLSRRARIWILDLR